METWSKQQRKKLDLKINREKCAKNGNNEDMNTSLDTSRRRLMKTVERSTISTSEITGPIARKETGHTLRIYSECVK
jgi:hypothetical protein